MKKGIHLQTMSKLHVYLLCFENINMFAKGNYRIKIQSFTNEQKCSIESIDKVPRSSELGKKDNEQYFTKEFAVRFQNQKVELNQLITISTPSMKNFKENKITIKMTLLKAENVKCGGNSIQYIPLRISYWISRFVMNSFCEYAESSFSEPFLSSLSVIILHQPVGLTIDSKMYKVIEEQDLFSLKKLVKKLRYDNYLMCNKFKKIFYSHFAITFTLPKIFVSGQKDMEEVNTDQEHLLNYLLLYETISLTVDQMNVELTSIALKNQSFSKIFKENCQKSTVYTNKLRMQFQQKQNKRYKQYISKQQYRPRYYQQYKPLLKQKLKTLNKQLQIAQLDQTLNNFIPKLQNLYQEPKPHQLPIFPVIIHETHKIKTPPLQEGNTRSKLRYILILAHGYQGCPQDLGMVANGFKRRYKKTKYLILKSYTQKMGLGLEAMSDIAVEEINTYLDCMNFKQKDYRIIMIGHSMGGLVLRLAANKMKYQEHLWSYISLGTPHLGYLQGLKLIIRAGLSLFSNIYSTPCLNELSCKDTDELHDTAIYQLSLKGRLSNFKKVILVASSHDKYVSWHSARIQNYNKDVLKQYTFIENEMVNNILRKDSNIERIDRLEIDFKIQESNMDKIIGRTSHIKLLTDLPFIELLCNSCIPQIFQD